MLAGAFLLQRSFNAAKISNDFRDDPLARVAAAYDTCQIPEFIKDPVVSWDQLRELRDEVKTYCEEGPWTDCDKGTQWQVAFTFNAVCLSLSSINFIVMAIGSELFHARYVGTICNCCYACCHCAAIIFAFAVRYNPVGRLCSVNVAPAMYQGDGEWDDEITY